MPLRGRQEEEGVDKFKSCVSATMRKCSNSNNNNRSSKDKLHMHMLSKRKQKKQITNGNAKTQATETSQCCALNVLVVVAVRDAQRSAWDVFLHCAHTHTHTRTCTRTINTYIYQFMVIGCCSSSLIAGIAAAATSQQCFYCCYALIMGIFGLCALHTCMRVGVCVWGSVRGCTQQTTQRAKAEFQHP